MDRAIIWSDAALKGLSAAIAYWDTDSPNYAALLALEAQRAAGSLRTLAERGRRVSSRPTFRELLVGSYRLIYLVEPDRVYVVAFAHRARDLRRVF